MAATTVAGIAPRAVDVKALNAEYETEVHFQKCYGVMTEIFDRHDNLGSVIPASGFKFLDLGCAPGGFSAFLLNDARCKSGFGVTLPSLSGGFPVRVRDSRFFLQQADLFEIGPADVLAPDVHVCICDAQYLRNNVSWDGEYKGVRCRSKQHGVWALLLKQFWLGLTKLEAGGALIFRFGWRDPEYEDPATVWYKLQTLRLFALLHDLFERVTDVKSNYFNALQSSFYVCCSNFDRAKFEGRQVHKLLGISFKYLVTTDIQDSNELDILPQVDKIRSPALDARISEMLDRINKLRLINQESSRWRRENRASRAENAPTGVVFVAPMPMEEQALASVFGIYGPVVRLDVDWEGGAAASVQFEFPEHAHAAVADLRARGTFGDGVRLWTRDEEGERADAWGCEWAPGGRGAHAEWS